MFNFKIHKKSSKSQARTGELTLPHGKVQTPIFMPCGTKASVKGVSPQELKTLGCQILLGNTYHLEMRPGSKFIAERGGLHEFMNWDLPILTDSGGFQVFSLQGFDNKTGKSGKSVKLKEDGVEFYSHIDGKKHFFSPKQVLDIQYNLGSDIMMVIDECADGNSSKEYAIEAMKRTHDWAAKCFEYFRKTGKDTQTLFPIVQGVTYPDLREQSAKFIDSLGSFGVAIGGLSVGESKETMYEMVECVVPHLSPEKPRYLMGVGTPEDLIENVYRGVDMFDCVLPTRLARHGCFYDETGRKNIKNAQFADDDTPVSDCPFFDLNKYSKAYVRHLIKEKEILGVRILSMHNLWFLFKLMQEIREHIANDSFEEFRKEFYNRWEDYKPIS